MRKPDWLSRHFAGKSKGKKKDDREQAGITTQDPPPTSHTSLRSPTPQRQADEVFPDGVKALVEPQNASVDICFVHGLTGNWLTTWTADGQADPWLRTLLPEKVPHARILTYGYDAYITKSIGKTASRNRLSDHARNLLGDLTADRTSCNASRRPLILVAHSLGGLVCKEAILLSQDNPEEHLQALFQSVKGIVFLGTPHRGSWMASWSHVPAKALGVVKSTNHSLLEILRESDQFLESIQERFLAMIRHLQKTGRSLELTCFFEELPLLAVGEVVSKDSATFPGYNVMSIHANHRDMVKFGNADENGFKRVVGELIRLQASTLSDDFHTTHAVGKPPPSTYAGPHLHEQRLVDAAQYLGISLSDATCISAASKCLGLLGSKDEVDVLLDYRNACLTSLDFQEMGTREHRVVRPELDTCQWIYKDPSYMRWAANENMLLWLKGRPGSGKSVLMKSLHASREQARDRRSTFMLKFFFNARGIQKERTIFGLYLALMHDLLSQDNILMAEFLPLYVRKTRQHSKTVEFVERDEVVSAQLTQLRGRSPTKQALPTGLEEDLWDAAELADIFHATIEKQSEKLIEIFIDALDECDEDEIRKLISRFEQTIDHARSSDSRLRICWSSRYYPRITLRSKQGLEIAIDSDNGSDIKTYVTRELTNFRSTLFEPLRQNILSRAQSVFLWVVQVIKLLRKAMDQGKRDHEILALLSTMPPELEDLFDQILENKSGSPEDDRDFIQLLQWTFCSQGDDVPVLGNLQQSFDVYLSMCLQRGSKEEQLLLNSSVVASSELWIHEINRINDISCGLINVSDKHKALLDREEKIVRESGNNSTDIVTVLRPSGTHRSTWFPSPEERAQQMSNQWPTEIRSMLESTAGNTAKIQVIHESVRDYFLMTERSLKVLRASTADEFIRVGHRDLAINCFHALLDFDLSEISSTWTPRFFKDDVMFLWRHRAEYLSRVHRNHFLIYAQRYGLTHFAQSHELFNNSRPLSSSPLESVSARKTVLRNYLRLIFLFELEEETMLYTVFEISHGQILRQHCQAFGATVEEVEAIWPTHPDHPRYKNIDYLYPPQWSPPAGMLAPNPSRWSSIVLEDTNGNYMTT